MRRADLGIALAALIAVVGALWVLESPRAGLQITDSRIGTTPVTRYAQPQANGPVVVVAHGFAGSRQIMQAYALTLARAGYVVHAFDFHGHGRNPVPMSGDLDSIDGTTQRLVEQTRAVVQAVAGDGQPVALLGHSMATDVLVRAASPQTGPLVLISAFSQAITPQAPRDLILVSGAWEPGLRDFALKAARMIDPGATEGETVTSDDLRRRAVIAPYADHVSILHSVVAQRAARDWLDGFYGRSSDVTIPRTGWALLVLLFSLVALFRPVSQLLPSGTPPSQAPSARQTAVLALLPAIAAPLVAVPLNPGLLPVLVADYLVLHLALFGALQLLMMRRYRIPLGGFSALAFAMLLIWGLGVFGFALDRYGTNFWPNAQRFWIVAALSLGAVPFMLADTALIHAAPLWQRVTLRIGFLASLGIAVALDFSGLFFLLMIAPVIALFYAIFGLMGRFAARRSGPMAAGLALGLVLAWAIGVSFPLFATNGG